MEHSVGDGRGVTQVESAARNDFVRDEDDVTQDCEKVFLDAVDHLTIDKGRSWRIVHLQLDTPGLAHDLHLEIPVTIEDLFGVVGIGAAVQYSQGAFAEQRVQPSLARVEKLADLVLGEVLEAAPRADSRVDEFRNDYAAVHTGRYGSISIGALSGVSSQISSMSEFDTAMQPSVQSTFS